MLAASETRSGRAKAKDNKGKMSEFTHVPVLAKEVLEFLAPGEGPRRIIDCTVGYGGHSSLILKNYGEAEILGLDRDADALEGARKALSFASTRVHLERGNFSSLVERAAEVGWTEVDAVLLDLGVSSPQIDDPQRGFSFRQDGPLDMRMDRRSPVSASRILNTASEVELDRIFRIYGEIKHSFWLAQAVVRRRETAPWSGTKELAELCDKVLGRERRRGGPPAPTLCFQALRIAVNEEIAQIEIALDAAVPLLKKGGRIVVISFHSLEDRIVKDFFKEKAKVCKCPPDFPVCICDGKAQLKILTKKPVTASDEELNANPRAACAKLRAAEKI